MEAGEQRYTAILWAVFGCFVHLSVSQAIAQALCNNSLFCEIWSVNCTSCLICTNLSFGEGERV